MRFTQSRKAIAVITGKNLQKDLERAVSTIEKLSVKNKEAAGHRASHLISMVFALENTLPSKTRFSIIEAIFADAAKDELPHQWERKYGYDCGKDNMCSKPDPEMVCYRDTWVPGVCKSWPQ